MKLAEEKATWGQKPKPASQKEKLQKWKEHFKKHSGETKKKITEISTKEIINDLLDIKLRHFTKEELVTVLKRAENLHVSTKNLLIYRRKEI